MRRGFKQFRSKGHKLSMSNISPHAGSRAGSESMGYGKSHNFARKAKAPPPPPKKTPKSAQRGR